MFDNNEKIDKFRRVTIIGPPENIAEKVSNPSEALNNIVILRSNILDNILTLRRIPHRMTNTLANIGRSELVFPTCGLMYNEADFSRMNIVNDGLHNLYTNVIEREECLFKLCILAMLIDPETKAKDCMTLTFGIHNIAS